jgi:Bifunctional DNA primase/polymerase, N-terminal
MAVVTLPPKTTARGPQVTDPEAADAVNAAYEAASATTVTRAPAALSAALAYGAAGWPVFATRPNDPSCPGGRGCQCKAPFPGTRGCLDASADPEVIRAWWRSWPTANVSIATGAPGPDVLDVDVKPDGDGWAAFNRLKGAGLLAGAKAIVRTPSGGLHSYYAGTAQRNGKLARHHLDFRSAGGYVLAPPSRVHGKPYELLDHRGGATGRLDWRAVTRLLGPPAGISRPARCAQGHPGDLGKLAAWVAGQQEGNRNDGLFWAACRAVEADHSDLDALVAAAVQAGLSEAEARRTIASAARKAATL